MADEYGADDALLAAMAAADSTPVARRPVQQQPRPQKIQQPTPQRLDKAPPAASGSGGKVVQPIPQSLPQRQGASNILVSPRQRGNPVLTHLKSMPWEYSDIPADYVLGTTTCLLFLSLKYHRLHPEYVYTRIRNLQGKYNLRILLTMIDIPNHEDPLRELSKTSMVNNVTIVCCWSAAEAARYLELYKAYEHASFDAIRGKQSSSYAERLVDFVTVPRSLNKTDAVALVANFGSLKNAVNADAEQLGMLSGWGGVKVKRWSAAIEEPFRAKNASKRILPTGDATAVAALAEPVAAGRGSRLQDAVPLSRVPLREMPAAPAATEATPEAGQPVNPSKQFQFRGDTDDEDDELEAAATTTSKTAEAASKRAEFQAGQADELSDGIAAALAKLRK
ncbi:hypothetical protein ARSEF4850_005900 [Beauveria asiatica]